MALKDRLGFVEDPLFLVDGTAYVYRAFYAYPDLKRSDGAPSNALFIVLRLLFKLLKEERPAGLGFFLDGRGPTFRNALFPAYKAQRQATPEALIAQLDPIREALDLLGLFTHTSEDCEADDCIASLAAREKAHRPVIVVGVDKDLKQCLDAGVYLWDPVGKTDKLLDLGGFTAETGLSPAQWPDYQALIGDSSDNIPGAPGVGPKTAAKIMERLPTLEAIRDNQGSLSPAEAKRLPPEVIEKLFMYRELTRLKTDRCPGMTFATLTPRPIDLPRLVEFLTRWEFRSLASEAKSLVGLSSRSVSPAAPSTLGTLGTLGAAGAQPKAKPAGSALSLLDLAESPNRIAINPETAFPAAETLAGKNLGLAVNGPHLLLALDGEEIPVHPGADPAPLHAAARIAVADLKAVLGAFPAFRALNPARFFDVGLAGYCINPEERDYSPDSLARRIAPGLDPDFTPPAGAALLLDSLAALFETALDAAGLGPLFRDLESPLAPVLAGMERLGVRIDRAAFAAFLADVKGQLAEIEAKADALVRAEIGESVNIRSSKQLGDLLFKRLKLKPAGKTPGGQASTSQEALEKLKDAHPLVALVLEHRTLEKLRSTYLDPMPLLADAEDRIHTTFNQKAAATGRLSSSNPNLQNIPIRGAFGPRMRACFVAAPGSLLVAADYSQIELRLLAHYSEDPALIKAFQDGMDVHARTAELLFEPRDRAVTPDERRFAKTINFGLVYGMGPQRLGQELGIPQIEAKAFIARYFERFASLKAFYERVVDEVRERGFALTWTGRRRFIPDIDSRNSQLQSQARRQAVNTVIQGGAADVIKQAMLVVAADPVLRDVNAGLILQIHDELVLEVPGGEDQAKAAGARLAELMAGVGRFSVPLVVDWGVGQTWAEAH